jgi:acyl dehydratase
MKYYEDIIVGENIIFPGRYLVTEENIIAVGKEWDPFPFHTDPVAAKETLYGGLVASTVHLFGISVKLGHSAENVIAAEASLGMEKLKNHAPAYAGDTLEFHCTHLEKRESQSRPGTGILRSAARLINQKGKILFSYETSALISMRV